MSVHASLTGLNLHEPKGADAASANTVYVSDGLGSGTWQKLDGSSIATTANPFGAQLLHVREQTNRGVNSVTGQVGSGWATRALSTTMTSEISGASLASSQLTMPAGTYYAEAHVIAPATGSGRHEIRLHDATTPTVLLEGITASEGAAAFLRGRFTISVTKIVRLQHTSLTTAGAGTSSSLGNFEVYADLMIWKLA